MAKKFIGPFERDQIVNKMRIPYRFPIKLDKIVEGEISFGPFDRIASVKHTRTCLYTVLQRDSKEKNDKKVCCSFLETSPSCIIINYNVRIFFICIIN
jgi:hypothetical protein